MIDKENTTIPGISEEKRPAQSIIKNVQHQHSHEADGQEIGDIVRVNEAVKSRLTEVNKVKRKKFCEWALNRIEQHNDIFICSDESWHEVGGPLHKKRRVSVPKEVGAYEYPRYEKSVPFSLMQWGVMTTKAQIGPQKIWEPETEAEKEANNAILKVINENIVAEVEKKRSQATIYDTLEYELLRSKNAEIDTHNAEH